MKLKKYSDSLGLVAVVILLYLVFSCVQPKMLTLFNIKSILVQVSITAIAAAGMTFAMTAGVFDLSIGSIQALLSVVIAQVGLRYGLAAGILAAVMVALLCGILNGLIVVKLKIQAFAATLVTMIIIRGIAILISEGKEIPIYSMGVIKIFSSGNLLGIPVPIIIMAVVYAVSIVLYYQTEFGMRMRSVGSNPGASAVSGIKTDKYLILAFICTAGLTVLSTIITTSQVMFGKGTIGEDFAMDVITTVVLGGTVLAGGKGNLTGTLAAAILVAVIKNGLNITGVNTYYQQMVIGTIFILALIMNNIKVLRAGRWKAGGDGDAGN